MKTLKFGIIGVGMMGKEFASASARWCHLLDMDIKPEIVSACGQSDKNLNWFRLHFPSVELTHDYRAILANPEIDAVYVAVPHHLHKEIYIQAIEAGKHLMGEKPFGIDLKSNEAIMASLDANPSIFARCSSQFPFAPAVQRIGDMLDADEFGEIIEIESGFLHSSDLNTEKPINWKRALETNGEYGVMGDLGMHVCHVPFRAGWRAKNVRAVLSNLVPERPDGKGKTAPCETWDNATMLIETTQGFPWTIKTYRIAPGEKNSWYLNIYGMKKSVRYSTKNANTLEMMEYRGGEQAWQRIDMGNETAFKTITAPIMEFGFSDALLQMWAAFCFEFEHKKPLKKFAGCAAPEEAHLSHKLFTAALESHKLEKTVNCL